MDTFITFDTLTIDSAEIGFGVTSSSSHEPESSPISIPVNEERYDGSTNLYCVIS
uniref:Putative pheromone Mr_Ph2 n=1 Tax=Moniliophthora roreri TaxID=221103 RepID=A0A0W0FBM2_MONRR